MPTGVYERKPWMRSVKNYSKEEIVDLVGKGVPWRKVAEIVGVSKAQVGLVLKKRKIQPCP
jgi:hypothetical protein